MVEHETTLQRKKNRCLPSPFLFLGRGQNVFLCIMSGSSAYSSAETHNRLNVLRPARMDPPIHVLYFRSGGAKILI